ncbi:hypothetical protein JAN5088_01711 [Jannaschia rubra]|uniref:DUF952 domain-containing protein n=2 Tax=Jannaschia rubra TaxID=282197 RepID=A0A0M6XQQ8_9RHOB|nr:hypothetical protein JAN5088_01711 [Jannaschia rubra]SFG27076.1 Uncharacterized conserved protein, DUF952 family [Jannaschia rubra]
MVLARRDFVKAHLWGGALDAAGCAGHAGCMIYKLFRTPEWQALHADGTTRGAPVDLADGYIHFSTAAQVAETAARHFRGVEGVWLIAVDEATVSDNLKWEPSRGGDLFPHLHAPLRGDQVAWAQPLPMVDGVHMFPAGLE